MGQLINVEIQLDTDGILRVTLSINFSHIITARISPRLLFFGVKLDPHTWEIRETHGIRLYSYSNFPC